MNGKRTASRWVWAWFGSSFSTEWLHDLKYPGLLHPVTLPPWQATADLFLHRRHSNTQRQVCLSLCGASGSWCTQTFVWDFQVPLVVMSCNLNTILPLLPSYWGFFFALACGISFFGGIQHSTVDGCSAVCCNFGVLTEDECMYFYFTILNSLGLLQNIYIYIYIYSF